MGGLGAQSLCVHDLVTGIASLVQTIETRFHLSVFVCGL